MFGWIYTVLFNQHPQLVVFSRDRLPFLKDEITLVCLGGLGGVKLAYSAFTQFFGIYFLSTLLWRRILFSISRFIMSSVYPSFLWFFFFKMKGKYLVFFASYFVSFTSDQRESRWSRSFWFWKLLCLCKFDLNTEIEAKNLINFILLRGKVITANFYIS